MQLYKLNTLHLALLIGFNFILSSCEPTKSDKEKISSYSSHLLGKKAITHNINLSSLDFMLEKNNTKVTHADFGVLDSDVTKTIDGSFSLKDLHTMYMIGSTYHWCNIINHFDDKHTVHWTYWKNGGKDQVKSFTITNEEAKRIMQDFGTGEKISLIFTNSGKPAADAKISLPKITSYTVNRFIKTSSQLRSR